MFHTHRKQRQHLPIDVGDAAHCSRCLRTTNDEGESLTLFCCDGHGSDLKCPFNRNICTDCCAQLNLDRTGSFFVGDLCEAIALCKQLQNTNVSALCQSLLVDAYNGNARDLNLGNKRINVLIGLETGRRFLELLGYKSILAMKCKPDPVFCKEAHNVLKQ